MPLKSLFKRALFIYRSLPTCNLLHRPKIASYCVDRSNTVKYYWLQKFSRGIGGLTMPDLGFRTYIPLLTLLIRKTCHYATKYRATIIRATEELDPSKVVDMETALDAITTACNIIELIETILDPNN